MRRPVTYLVLLAAALACARSAVDDAPNATGLARGRQGVVATGHPLATDAARQAMRDGGNAVDAVVAAALTLGIVDGHNSGLGGGCFLLVRRPDGQILAVDGRETAPAGASRDMFVRGGKAETRLSQTGPLAVGVPGALAAYDLALARYGKLTLRQHLLKAARLAEEGFPIDRPYAKRLAETANELRQFEAARAIFLRADSTPWTAGEKLLQRDLAATYRAVAEQGTAWFYQGPFAELTGAWMAKHGGVMVAEDFRRYRIKLREPIVTTYRGFEIVGFPPPSSGGVHVAQVLNILERFDLKALGAGSADFIHVTAEAMKLAFADRAHWLGDPDFTPVPLGLISREYAAALAAKIRLDHASAVGSHGTPANATNAVFGRHTTHFTAADAEGNWVACTATLNTSFGSKVVVPGTGVLLNNQMDDFSAQPGVTNYFGLIGGEANAVAPGKRPLSSMSPTIVLKGGRPVFTVGAAGGPTIITQTVLAIVNVVDFGLGPDAALARPRFHHQWLPDELRIEKSVGEATIAELRRRGHEVRPVDSLGAAQAIGIEGNEGRLVGAPDPRSEGRASGW